MDERVVAAVRRFGSMDPTGWETGLSAPGARAALHEAVAAVLAGPWQAPDPVPDRVVIWCAANVFTAPLEWTAQLVAAGSKVVLKAPSRCPAPARALAQAFDGLGVRTVVQPHERAVELLATGDPVLGMGGDAAMAQLARHLLPGQPRSLHGHRVSFAVVQGSSPDLARALARDAALYDGAGCMSPAAVFALGDHERLAAHLADAMAAAQRRWPRGEVDPAIGPRWRTRTGLARVLGASHEGPGWAVPVLPLHLAQASVLPRMLPVHPVSRLAQLAGLAELPLSSCATDLGELELGFPRLCAPGSLQAPRTNRHHDGVDVMAVLSGQVSGGSP